MAENLINAVVKGFNLLELFRGQDEMGVTEIADRMDMSKGQAHRFLSTFKTLGLVEKNPHTDRYRPSVGLLELSYLYLGNIEWQRTVRPFLEELSSKTDETVYLAILDKTKVVYVDEIESKQLLRLVSQVGLTRPAHCTGTGKALLSGITDAELQDLYRSVELTRYTRYTLTDLDKLLHELGLIRNRGYAVDNEEYELGVFAIGSLIKGAHGEPVAALSVSCPKVRVNAGRIDELASLVTEVCKKASKALGWRE